MTLQTKRLFQRVGDAPRERLGHRPAITIAGSTVKAVCSCGHKLGGGRDCNRAGMDYVISWAKTAYETHTEETK